MAIDYVQFYPAPSPTEESWDASLRVASDRIALVASCCVQNTDKECVFRIISVNMHITYSQSDLFLMFLHHFNTIIKKFEKRFLYAKSP
jgi:hypothetical protein